MKQYDKLKKFGNVSSYTISKLQDLLYLLPNVSEHKFETKYSVQKSTLQTFIPFQAML